MFEKSKAKKAFNRLMPVLTTLDGQLREVESVANPIDRIVKLFGVVSPLSDRQMANNILSPLYDSQKPAHDEANVRVVAEAFRKINKGKRYDEVIQSLEALGNHFENAGRGSMNRTEPGEAVTPDKVFLGEINGIWANTVPFWKEKLDQSEGIPARVGDAIRGQARTFTEGHIRGMRGHIASLARLKV